MTLLPRANPPFSSLGPPPIFSPTGWFNEAWIGPLGQSKGPGGLLYYWPHLGGGVWEPLVPRPCWGAPSLLPSSPSLLGWLPQIPTFAGGCCLCQPSPSPLDCKASSRTSGHMASPCPSLPLLSPGLAACLCAAAVRAPRGDKSLSCRKLAPAQATAGGSDNSGFHMPEASVGSSSRDLRQGLHAEQGGEGVWQAGPPFPPKTSCTCMHAHTPKGGSCPLVLPACCL